MTHRKNRASIAENTLKIIKKGHYQNKQGKIIALDAILEEMREKTVLWTPENLDSLRSDMTSHLLSLNSNTAPSITVTEETTLNAARRLAISQQRDDVLCLNFASAKNPGGGFLGGSQAQEESLARASGLYDSLLQAPGYYQANRQTRDGIYTDHMIYSPGVPVFRDDQDQLLLDCYKVAFATAPAVNAGVVQKKGRRRARNIPEIMRRRVDNILALAAQKGHRTLVLGAWGCGVFRNDPSMIAKTFREALAPNSPLADAFDEIIFAIYERGKKQPVLKAFLKEIPS